MKITPHVNLLRSLRGKRIDYTLLIGEGADNAFDAGARSVRIEIEPTAIRFIDDGCGITRDRIAALFSLGGHGGMTSTSLGRFGVGIKSQAVNAGDILRVSSVSRDGRVMCAADWPSILRSGEWEISDPKWKPVIVGKEMGTTITIEGLKKPPPVSFEKLIQEIQERFHPALAEGREVFFNGRKVCSLEDPAMSDIVDRTIQMSDGRSARLHGGLLLAPGRLHRVHVGYGHRVIMPSSSLGCKSYGGINKMFARVHIFGKWHLAEFKNDLPDETEREELDDAVHEVLRPVLEKCNSASISAKIVELTEVLNEMVPPELQPARPRQKQTKEKSDKSGKGGGLVRPEDSDVGGPARSKRAPRDELRITFDGISGDDGVGKFVPGRPHRVDLSPDDPTVALLSSHRDTAIGARAILTLAMAIFEDGRRELPSQREFEFVPFGVRIARDLAVQNGGAAAEAS